MNTLQRHLLFLFAGLIFFHSVSSYESSTESHLRLFFSAVLIVLAISPRRWFMRTISSNSISFEGLTVFKALLKLRSVEITAAYSAIREYQDKVGKEGNWIALFMKEQSTIPNDSCTEYSEKKQRQLEEKAIEKFNSNYKFCSLTPLDLYRDKIKDVKIALLFWNVGPGLMQHNLKGLREFMVVPEQIDRLIRFYARLGSGSFYALFGNDPRKFLRRIIFDQIQWTWAEIIGSLKMRFLLEKMKNEQHKNNTELNEILEELTALEDLTFSLDLAITQKSSRRLGSSSSKKNEELLLTLLPKNPFWCH